jgi:hypothetical protein
MIIVRTGLLATSVVSVVIGSLGGGVGCSSSTSTTHDADVDALGAPPDASAETGLPPECAPQHGELRQPGGFFPWTAVPRGPCGGNGSECTIAASGCCNATESGQVNGWTCTCTTGTWACILSSPGAGACDNDASGGEAPLCGDAAAGD